jgi:serine/threonine protein phosphatase PrpC
MTSSEAIDIASKDTSISAKPVPLVPKAFGVTDTGKVRTANEDQFLIAELSKAMRVWQTSLPEPMLQHGEERAHVFLVADGMGGHQAGERASALVVVAIEQFMLNAFKWFFEADNAGAQRVLGQFQSALRQADVQMAEESKANPELRGMGTTVTLAFHLGRQICIVHVGDSRAYLHRDGSLHQLTEDHTLIEQMRRNGTLGPDQVLPQRFRHVITNAVGGNELGVKVEARAFELQPGDRLLLCSDGLTEAVSDEAIARLLNTEPAPEAAAKSLLDAAIAGPAADNITAVVVRFDLPE